MYSVQCTWIVHIHVHVYSVQTRCIKNKGCRHWEITDLTSSHRMPFKLAIFCSTADQSSVGGYCLQRSSVEKRVQIKWEMSHNNNKGNNRGQRSLEVFGLHHKQTCVCMMYTYRYTNVSKRKAVPVAVICSSESQVCNMGCRSMTLEK